MLHNLSGVMAMLLSNMNRAGSGDGARGYISALHLIAQRYSHPTSFLLPHLDPKTPNPLGTFTDCKRGMTNLNMLFVL